MGSEDALLVLGTALFAVGWLADITFFLIYVRGGRAFKSSIGLMFVLMSGSTLLTGIAILLGRVFGIGYPGRSILTLVVYASFAAAMVWKLVVFLVERSRAGYRQTEPVVREFHRHSTVRRRRRRISGNTGPVQILQGD